MTTLEFTAGLPAMVTRPLTEAVRGRLSRCGVCALAAAKTARRTIERKIGNRAPRNIMASLRGAEKRPRIAPSLSLNVLCQNMRRFEATMTKDILRMASRRRKRRAFHTPYALFHMAYEMWAPENDLEDAPPGNITS